MLKQDSDRTKFLDICCIVDILMVDNPFFIFIYSVLILFFKKNIKHALWSVGLTPIFFLLYVVRGLQIMQWNKTGISYFKVALCESLLLISQMFFFSKHVQSGYLCLFVCEWISVGCKWTQFLYETCSSSAFINGLEWIMYTVETELAPEKTIFHPGWWMTGHWWWLRYFYWTSNKPRVLNVLLVSNATLIAQQVVQERSSDGLLWQQLAKGWHKLWFTCSGVRSRTFWVMGPQWILRFYRKAGGKGLLLWHTLKENICEKIGKIQSFIYLVIMFFFF